MTKEKTIEKDDSVNGEKLNIDSVMKLDEHNPIGDVGSEAVEQMVKVKEIDIPSIRKILSSTDPKITINIETEQGKDVKMDMVLDKFSSGDVDDTQLSSFCLSLGIEKNDLHKIINERIPLKISRTGQEFETRISHGDKEIEVEDKDTQPKSWRFRQLQKLWKAQEYGKARIIEIGKVTDRGVTIKIEIPWLNEERRIRFSNSKEWNGLYPSFPGFYKSLVGRYPLNADEMNSIVGEEILVDYSGKFGISSNLKRKIEKNKRDFMEYVTNNKKKLGKNMLFNSFYLSFFYIMPPLVIVPLAISMYLASFSIGLAWMSVIFLLFASSALLTTLDAYDAYLRNEPLDESFSLKS